METNKKIGQCENQGYQIEPKKTIAVPSETAWNFLLSEKGLALWLGEISLINFELGKPYKTKEGIRGEVNTLHPYSHICLSWKPVHWINSSALQMSVLDAKGKSTISFNQSELLGNDQQEEMRRYWENVIQKIENELLNLQI